MRARSSEPVLLGSVDKAITSVLGFLIIMGWVHWTPEQIAAFVVAVNGVGGVALAMFARSRVTPNRVAEARVNIAVAGAVADAEAARADAVIAAVAPLDDGVLDTTEIG